MHWRWAAAGIALAVAAQGHGARGEKGDVLDEKNHAHVHGGMKHVHAHGTHHAAFQAKADPSQAAVPIAVQYAAESTRKHLSSGAVIGISIALGLGVVFVFGIIAVMSTVYAPPVPVKVQ